MNLPSSLLLVAACLAPSATLQDETGERAVAKHATMVETLSEELEGGTGGLEVDGKGFVYCADFGSTLGIGATLGTRVFRLDPETGAAEVFVDGLRGASGNAFGPDGDLFQSNIRGNVITRIRPDGSASTFLAENLRGPVGIAIDAQGVLFVANCGGNSILAVTPDGESLVLSSDPLLS